MTGDNRFHSGIDFVIEGDDARVRTPAGGTAVLVLPTESAGGFGNTVVVRTPQGFYEQYSHLQSMAVRQGDFVAPGQELGIMGNTGVSTGPHVHFTVYTPGTDESQIMRGNYEALTIDPRHYLRDIQSSVQRPLGVGAPPVQAPRGVTTATPVNNWSDAAQVYMGYMFSNTAAVSAERIFNNANPQISGRASINRRDYPSSNDASHNYGYAVLQNDRSFREALTRVANKHNIPAQWLADVIQFESGMDVRAGESTWQRGASGIGLIQFYRGGGLADVAQAMRTSEAVAAQRLMNMSPAEQMNWVDFYLSSSAFNNGFRTIEDLLAAIFGGPELYNKSPNERRDISDINISFGDYVRRLGNSVGRRYQTSYDQALETYHYNYVDGCPTCAQMIRHQTRITAHRGGR